MRVHTAPPPLTAPLAQLRRVLTPASVVSLDAAVLGEELDDYLIPGVPVRGPVLTVVSGPTGVGKSTIVNSIVGANVSATGVLRPTTHTPLLIAHPVRQAMAARRLPDIAMTASPRMPRSIAMVDCPDPATLSADARLDTQKVLGAGDIWLFVVSAARYADALPWEALLQARERGTTVAIVLNRVAPEAVLLIHRHLTELLAANGLADAPVHVIAQDAAVAGRLSDVVARQVREWFLVFAEVERPNAPQTTFDGALAALPLRISDVAAEVEATASAALQLHAHVVEIYGRALRQVYSDMESGVPLCGEVVTSWREMVAAGDVLHALDGGPGLSLPWTRPASVRRIAHTREALAMALENLISTALRSAADDVAAVWRADPHGAALFAELEIGGSLEPAVSVTELVASWEAEVIAQAGPDRYLAEATAVLASIVAFGGFTDGVGRTAAGASFAAELTAALADDQLVRPLAETARTRLQAALATVFHHAMAPFAAAVARLAVDLEVPAQLRDAALAIAANRVSQP